MYEDSDESKTYSNGSGGGVFLFIILALVIGLFMIGCNKIPPKLQTFQISNELLTLQMSSCSQNDGVKYWEATFNKYGYVVKTSIICNNGMIKDFQVKDM